MRQQFKVFWSLTDIVIESKEYRLFFILNYSSALLLFILNKQLSYITPIIKTQLFIKHTISFIIFYFIMFQFKPTIIYFFPFILFYIKYYTPIYFFTTLPFFILS
jgi:hypothetical protein